MTVMFTTVTRPLVATLNVSTTLSSEVFLITMLPVPLLKASERVITRVVGGTKLVALSAGLRVTKVGALRSIIKAGDMLPLKLLVFPAVSTNRYLMSE